MRLLKKQWKKKAVMNMHKAFVVVGKISVKAILENRKRDIETVYILETKKDKEARYILSLCKDLNVKKVSREVLNAICETDNHGGYAVLVKKRLSDEVTQLKESHSIMCVEGVRDPFHMGEILRSIKALGFDALISPSYDFYEHEAKLIRASAGASESILWLQSEDLVKDLQTIKKEGFTLISAHRQEESTSLVNYVFDEKVCIILGGALRGISKEILNMSDDFVRLDYETRFALSTQAAAGIFAYAHYFQKNKE